MENNPIYPKYVTYEDRQLQPSVLSQEYPLPNLVIGEKYYPDNKRLINEFTSEKEVQKFGAAQFCSFLSDTIEVEHCLVIPAIVALRRIPFKIPSKPKQDLYKTATDEGYHAEQALMYLSKLEEHFELLKSVDEPSPLFLRRLELQKSSENNPIYRELITVLNGIVTETRISVELSKFAINKELTKSVREVCLTHSKDEAIHASQFQALGQWLWDIFDEKTKAATSIFLIESTIARSLPDISNLVYSFMKATGRTKHDSKKIILSKYNADTLIESMILESKPTLQFLSKLGVESYLSFSDYIEKERFKLEKNLSFYKKQN